MAIIGGKNKKEEDAIKVEPHDLISSTEVKQIREALIESHADMVIRGMLNKDVRESLRKVVKRNFSHATKNNSDVIDYVVREAIGTGVVEEILKDEEITDIGYNGSELIIETNDKKIKYETTFDITDNYIVRLVNKFANSNNKEFTAKNSIFDGRFENVRINAVHVDNTAPESATTMALRVVRPRLALQKKNFEGFAPMFIYDLLRASALTKANMVISGITGTGKTELHKLISSFIPFDDRIILIEDTPETFMKEMFPEKDIYSWVTSEDVTVTQLIKAGLRNHPAWLMVTETRGKEAYEMIQAVLSGHSIITSLHAVDARAIPSRFVNMAKMGYELSEEALIDDIRRYFHFGIHIKKAKYNGHIVRYLQEIVEFNPDGDRTIFKQRFVDGVFTYETFPLSEEFTDMLEEGSVKLSYPEPFKSERLLYKDSDKNFKPSIPTDNTGRPDYKKIEKMGTTLGILMGREKPEFDPNEDDFDISDYLSKKDGFIDFGDSETDTKMNAKMEKLKKKVEAKVTRETEKEKPSKESVSDILGKMDTKKKVKKKQAKRPTIPKSKKKHKSIDELLDEKRKLLQNEDV